MDIRCYLLSPPTTEAANITVIQEMFVVLAELKNLTKSDATNIKSPFSCNVERGTRTKIDIPKLAAAEA